jgi:Arc/MetJ-type ribon-helix-helix transcriptional regulator
MEAKSRTRAFRIPLDLDRKVDEKAKKDGFMRPSDYLRELVRKDIVEEA